ncbi:glycine zipper family protein, partial [uncultured Parabacteroides sp.]|uniref:glycine zipper family protein n=1 Tax=uncultured Parabacteroides sp. TaxID=512312 RepID=UPI0025DAD2CF
GGYRGEAIGSFVGSVGGTVLGATAASSQNQRNRNATNARVYQLPYVVIEDIYLEDRNNNQIVDAGETCRISFILSNEGKQTAYNLEPIIKVEKGGKYVKLSNPVTIGQLQPGKRMSYTITLHASPKLKAGEISLSVRLKSSDGYLTDKETFTLPTGRY